MRQKRKTAKVIVGAYSELIYCKLFHITARLGLAIPDTLQLRYTEQYSTGH